MMKSTPLTYSLLRYTIILLISVSFLMSFGQMPTVQDCFGAIPVCQDTYTQTTTYLGSGNYPNEIYNPPSDCTTDCPGSCLDGEQNSVWYVFTVQQSGQLRLTIDPFYDADDYDWAVYDITVLRCDNIYAHYNQMQKSCNAFGSLTYNGNTGISTANGGTTNCNHCGEDASTNRWNADLPVDAGKTYVLVMENWGTTPEGGYVLDFSASTAVIYDNVRPYLDIVHSEDITCGDAEIVVEFSENVACESVNPGDFVLSGPGGPYTVLDVQGEACLIGAPMEQVYTIYIDRPISQDGAYSLELTPMAFVYDACNNFSLGNTITFQVSLGAPIINETGLTISSATCGLSNGSITGLVVTGNPPFTFLWTNSNGDTVGTSVNLVNIPSGNYYFQVNDPNTCVSSKGPYFVDQTGAPGFDDQNKVITSATYNANNGSITGIQANGAPPLVFTWYDSGNNIVGNNLDLLNVYTGLYTLQVTDANSCDTLAGPYFVPEIGGPVSVTVVASLNEICIGGSTQLLSLGTGGTGTYTYSWTSSPAGFTSTIPNPVVIPTVTTIYTVVIDDGYNLANGSVTITVDPLPVANAGTDTIIPYGTSLTLHGDATVGSGNYHWAWTPQNMLINPTVQTPATLNLYQTTFFFLTATDDVTGCVSLQDTVMIQLNGGPLGVTAIAQKDSLCIGESTTLTAVGFGGNEPFYTYTWKHGQEVIKIEDGVTSSLVITPVYVGTHEYNIEIFDGFNTYTTQLNIECVPSPTFSISGGPDITACPYDTVNLEPDHYFDDWNYYWSNGATTRSIQVGTTGLGFDQKTYYLTVVNRHGCTFADSVTVTFDFAACFGIHENDQESGIRVYPDPTRGLFTVEFENIRNYRELVILDARGQQVFRQDLSGLNAGFYQRQVDLSVQPRGIYLLKAINDRYIHLRKIVVN
jgi:hypothetical protein